MSRLLRRWLADHRGVAALEFALVALPFLMVTFGTLEIGLLMFKTSIMEGATRDAARQVRTGAAQTSANPLVDFQTAFCNGLFGMYDCATFYFDVRNFASFTAIALPAITFDANGIPNNVVFQPGGPGTVSTVRVLTNHVFATPLIGSIMGSAGNNTLVVSSTTVLKAEPYQ